MANYVFETMSQADAAAFTPSDFLIFISSTTNASNVVVSTTGSDQLTQTGTVVTAGAKSLTFNQSNISQASLADQIVFNDQSNLILGTQNANSTFGAGPDNNPAFSGDGSQTDVIYGFAGNDFLGSSSGSNTSNDFIYGGAGGDSIVGGAGAEHLYGFGSVVSTTDGADTISGFGGSDYLQGNGGNDILDGGTGEDRIFGGQGNDTITGGEGNDTVNGNIGDDSIFGGDGQDFLRGGQGNDSINGEGGNDQLLGDLGSDSLNGGVGIDVLTGGDGADRFIFSGAQSGAGSTANGTAGFYDSIADYVDNSDKIDLNFAVTTVLQAQAGVTFTSVDAATVYAQQLLDASTATTGEVAAIKVNSDTYLFSDDTVGGSGATVINSVIKLTGIADPSQITTTDFV